MIPLLSIFVLSSTPIWMGCSEKEEEPEVSSARPLTPEEKAIQKEMESDLGGGSVVIPVETPEAAEELVQQSVVKCDGPCGREVESLALMTVTVMKTDRHGRELHGINQCTSFLYQPSGENAHNEKSFIITNGHCVPESQQARSQCKNINFHFPSIEEDGEVVSPAQSVACKKILSVNSSSHAHSTPGFDLALFELEEKIDRSGLKIDSSGVEEFEILDHPHIDPVRDHLTVMGKIETQECKAVFGTVFAPGSTQTSSLRMIFQDCPLQNGNSGSPLVGKNGRVKVVMNMSPDPESRHPLDRLARKHGNEYEDFGFGVNLSCIEMIRTAESYTMSFLDHQTCHLRSSHSLALPLRPSEDKQSWKATIIDFDTQDQALIVALTPSCIHRENILADVFAIGHDFSPVLMPEMYSIDTALDGALRIIWGQSYVLKEHRFIVLSKDSFLLITPKLDEQETQNLLNELNAASDKNQTGPLLNEGYYLLPLPICEEIE